MNLSTVVRKKKTMNRMNILYCTHSTRFVDLSRIGRMSVFFDFLRLIYRTLSFKGVEEIKFRILNFFNDFRSIFVVSGEFLQTFDELLSMKAAILMI